MAPRHGAIPPHAGVATREATTGQAASGAVAATDAAELAEGGHGEREEQVVHGVRVVG